MERRKAVVTLGVIGRCVGHVELSGVLNLFLVVGVLASIS
jgi:hypothetical protein